MKQPDRKRYAPFSPLERTLKDTLRVFKLEGRFYQQRVLDVWNEAVGETIATVAQPAHIRFKTLTVNVAESGWLHHLANFHDLFVEKINRKVGREVIQRIYFRIGEIRPAASIHPAREGEKARWPYPPRPSLTGEEIEACLAPIKDLQLRSIVEKMLSRFKDS